MAISNRQVERKLASEAISRFIEGSDEATIGSCEPMSLLVTVQEEFGYVPPPAIPLIAKHTGLERAAPKMMDTLLESLLTS